MKDTPEVIVERIIEMIKMTVMLPSQERIMVVGIVLGDKVMRMNMDAPGVGMERIIEMVRMDVGMLPSQEEPVKDPGGLWYAGGKGVMIVGIVRQRMKDAPEVIVERIIEMMKMAVRMLLSQEEPVMDLGGLWYAGGKGVMMVEIMVMKLQEMIVEMEM